MFLCFLSPPASVAQTVRKVTVNKDGETVVVEEAVKTSSPAAASENNGKENSDTKKGESGDSKKSDGDKTDSKGDKGAGESGTVTRPTLTDKPAANIEDEVSVGDKGQVTFNLRGQPWEAVLQWLADTSKMSLDWQELPGDALNLTTNRSYSLEEARDMINRHLLSRGYSMVLNGELLSVMKLSDVKSSLVPRVTAEQLQQTPDHTLCKMSFDLQWLIADEVVEEIAPLLSNAGKISKMSRTNRLEIMDTAGTLKDVYSILSEEQSDTGQEQLVKTFHLKHRRAEEVIVLLRDLLGVDPPPGSGGGGRGMGDMGQIANVMKQMTQQLQRMGNSGSKGGGGREPTKTRLVLNPRENMILAQAMPDQMAIIEKALEQIDVPVEATNSLIQNMSKMKIYRLETVNPQTLVDLLQELGDMGPGTVLKVDDDKKAIVAFASLADHLTITTLVERLDQSGRAVEVIPLRRLEADYVAGTIRALMIPPEKEQTNSRYSYYSRYSSQPEQKEDKKFKVEADIENNRLLVYANKTEMDEIYKLLQKLGEIPDPGAADNGMRVFELSPGEDAYEVMERIKRLWHRDNELKFNLPPRKPETDNSPPETKTDSDKAEDAAPAGGGKSGQAVTTTRTRPLIEVWPPRPQTSPAVDRAALNGKISADQFFDMIERSEDLLVAVQSRPQNTQKAVTPLTEGSARHARRPGPAAPRDAIVSRAADKQSLNVIKRHDSLLAFMDEPLGQQSTSDRPPIQFSVTADGHLIVTSDDKAALQEIEDLMQEVVRPAPKYKVFTLKYATPSWVTLNLEDYFKAEAETETSMNYDFFWGYYPSTKKKSSSPSLGRRRTPTFIYDNFTSTILVRDADRRQLQLIEDLINVYDVPEPADTRSMRVTKIFRLQNSKAEVVAQAVKDVFRDLLSANDKALEKKNQGQQQTRVYSYFGNGGDDDSDSPIRFKGLLSVGIDPNSDTLVISSTAALMETISELVVELDKAGETSSSVQVVKVDSSVDIQLIQERLNKALGNASGNQDQQKKNRNGQQTGPGVPVGGQPRPNN